MDFLTTTISAKLEGKRNLSVIGKPDYILKWHLKEIGNDMNEIKKRLKKYKANIEFLVSLVASRANKSKIQKILRDRFAQIDKIEKDIQSAMLLRTVTEKKFGFSGTAKRVVKDIEKMIAELTDLKKKADKAISKLVKTKKPRILDDKADKITRMFIEQIKAEVKHVKAILRQRGVNAKKLKVGESKYYARSVGKNIIRFARFIPIENVPFYSDPKQSHKTIYIVLYVDITAPKMGTSRISGQGGNLFVSVTSRLVNPATIKKAFEVVTPEEFINALSHLCFERDAFFFQEKKTIEPKLVRKRIQEGKKIKILKQTGVKIKPSTTEIKVTIPKKVLPKSAKAVLKENPEKFNDTQFFKDLFVEIERAAGYPVDKRKRPFEFKTLMKITEKNLIFRFFIMPRSPKRGEEGEIPKIKPEDLFTVEDLTEPAVTRINPKELFRL